MSRFVDKGPPPIIIYGPNIDSDTHIAHALAMIERQHRPRRPVQTSTATAAPLVDEPPVRESRQVRRARERKERRS